MYHYLGEDVAAPVDINGQPILTAGSAPSILTARPGPGPIVGAGSPGLFGLTWLQLLGLAAVALVVWWAWTPTPRRHRGARARQR